MKTIFNTYINVDSQEQADRLKKICIDNRLPIWNYKASFIYKSNRERNIFEFFDREFWVTGHTGFTNQVTESEWLELLEEYKTSKP